MRTLEYNHNQYKSLLATNLQSMGVTSANSNQDLSVLTNKVSEINPVINSGLELTTQLILTSPSNSIGLNNNMTLTGVLTASYDDTGANNVDLTGYLSNASIKLYKDNTLIDTQYTNNQGIVTFTYNDNTVGNHNLYIIFEGSTNYPEATSDTLTIRTTPNTNNITLTLNKSDGSTIVSAFHGEILTFTANATDINNEPVEGVQINFYDSNNNLIDTSLTDSNGDAIGSYVANNLTGHGSTYSSKSVYATDGNITSETETFYDYYYYDKAATNRLTEYTSTSNLTSTYYNSSYGYKLLRKTDGFDSFYRTDLNFNAPCNLYGYVRCPTASNSQCTLFLMGASKNIGLRLSWVDDPRIISVPLTAESTESVYATTSYLPSTATWYRIRLYVTSAGKMTARVLNTSGTTLMTLTANIGMTSFRGIGLQVLYTRSRYICFKNILITQS